MRGAAPHTPARVPLTGADCFLRAFDHEIRRSAGASHVSQLVLRLGPGFDPGIFCKLLAEVARAQPMLRAPVRRRLGLLPPVYRLDAAPGRPLPRIAVHERAERSQALPDCFADRLNQPLSLRRGELLRFDLVRYAGGAAGTDLAASWAHQLFDGSGSERFVRWLDACFRGASSPDALPEPDELAPPGRARTGLRERGERARSWQRFVHQLGDSPMRSLAGPLRRAQQALRCELHAFSAPETARIAEAARRRAGFLTPMLFYLAAAIRAHAAVFRARGVDPGSFVVPLAVNLRPKGGEGAIFRTHTGLLWFRVLGREVEPFDALLESLKRQRLAAIRDGHVENSAHAMHFARWAPARLYARLARAALRGELCSFFFAYTDAFLPGMQRFLGSEIRDGFHVAPVPPSPGSCLALSLREGRLNATHTYQDGVLSEPEREIFRAALRDDLLGAAP